MNKSFSVHRIQIDKKIEKSLRKIYGYFYILYHLRVRKSSNDKTMVETDMFVGSARYLFPLSFQLNASERTL